ncbi:MAG: TetR/AcrR family transcriptional regulator [Methyloligellaceae bacterium]
MAKQTGRPRTFDKDTALQNALNVFCIHGFEGTSLSRLTEAMGINSPSLYSAFGDKERLFLSALDHYYDSHTQTCREMLFGETDTVKAFEDYFNYFLNHYETDNSKVGCLVVNSTINNNSYTQKIAEKLKSLHDRNEAMLVERIELGIAQGDIPKTVNATAIARYVNGMQQGAAVLIRGQQSKDAVKDLITQSMVGLKAMLGR